MAPGWEVSKEETGKVRYKNGQLGLWGFSSPRQFLLVLAERAYYEEKWETCRVGNWKKYGLCVCL